MTRSVWALIAGAATAGMLLAGCGAPAQCGPCFGGVTLTVIGTARAPDRLVWCLAGRCGHTSGVSGGPVPVGPGVQRKLLVRLVVADRPQGFDWEASNGQRLVIAFSDPATGVRYHGTGTIESRPGKGACGCPMAAATIVPPASG